MPHPIVYKGAQFGIQSALGTIEPADIKLLTPGFSRIAPRATGGYVHTNSGSRLPSSAVPPGYHDSEVSFEGPMDYVCMTYLMAFYFGSVTPIADGTNGKAWDFSLGLNSGNTRIFSTYENGNASRAERALNSYGNAFTIESSKATQRYSGSLRAGKKVSPATITGSPTEVSPLVAAPQSFEVFMADTKAALDTAVTGGSQILTPFPLMVTCSFPEIADPLPRMHKDETSFADVMDKALSPTFAFKTTDEADFDALRALIDTGAKKFFALQSVGAEIAGAVASAYQIRVDFCGAVIEPESVEEEASAAAHTLTFQNIYDATWGKAHNIRIINTLASL